MIARNNRTTIVIRPEIRDGLKHIARKDQSYNELLAELLKLHADHVKVVKSCGEHDLAPAATTAGKGIASRRVKSLK